MQLLLVFSIILLGLTIGRVLRVYADRQRLPGWFPLAKFLRFLTLFVLLGMMPIILVGAFWNADLTNQTFLVLPVLGVFTIFLGGVLAVLSAKWMKMSREQTGSMFVTGAFLNLGSFGGLFVVFFIGLEALPFVALFRLFEELVYYTICYPIARKFGAQRTEDSQPRWKRILKDPFIMVIFSAICVGALLNVSSIPYATVYDQVNELFVPLTVIFLLIPVGFSMRIGAVGENSKAVTVIITIKHLIVPVTVTGVAYLLGLGAYADGMLLKVILILSAMPPAVSALVPPQLFGLDEDLANANWIVSTVGLVVTLPILYILTGMM